MGFHHTGPHWVLPADMEVGNFPTYSPNWRVVPLSIPAFVFSDLGQNGKMNSHIIPAFYLEGFASTSTRGPRGPGRVWVYEKGCEPDERATSVQGRENG